MKIHNGENLNKCDQCGYATVQASNLQKHILRKHLNTDSREKLNKCNQCNYASDELGMLKRHMKTHEDDLVRLEEKDNIISGKLSKLG